MAAPRWNKLSEAEKERYKAKSQTMDQVPNLSRKTYNSFGEDMQEVEARKQKDEEAKESMQIEVKLMLENASEIGGNFQT